MQNVQKKDKPGSTLLGSVNTRLGKQLTILTSLYAGHFSLSETRLEGSAFNTVLPAEHSGDFFVRTSGRPVRLLHYRLQGEDNTPELIREVRLPDRSPDQFNGMAFMDANGDGRREMVVAYTAGGREKMVVLGWE